MEQKTEIIPDFIGQEEKAAREEAAKNELQEYDKNWGIIKPEGKNLKDEDSQRLDHAIKFFVDKIHLAKQFITIIPLFYDVAGLFWVWNFQLKKYEIKDDVHLLNKIDNCANANIISSKERTEILNALKQVGRLNQPIKLENEWIQTKGEITNILTGERKEATPIYFITNPIPYKIGKSEETPKMDIIFEEWVGKDYVKTLYQIIAYCLYTDYPLHKVFWFVGAGLNGKSCFLRLLKKFIGLENITATELDILVQSRFEITRLYKKLVCMMGEANISQLDKTSYIKKLTGGDLINFEYKNKTPFTDTSYAKLLIATNNLPTTTDKTIGFYRRNLIIDFNKTFSEAKDILMDVPEEEYENLVLKCITILSELLKNRQFHNEGSIEERIKRYEDRSDPMEKFWAENIIEDYESRIYKHEFREQLKNWCSAHKFRQFSDRDIIHFMKNKSISEQKVQADWYNETGQKPFIRAWMSIKFKETSDYSNISKQFTLTTHIGERSEEWVEKPEKPEILSKPEVIKI